MTNAAFWLVDLLLGLTALALAAMALSSRNRHQAVALFMAFGLVLALIWVRLSAPDLALAEAAIGAGLTGVFLLQAIPKRRSDAATGNASPWLRPRHYLALGLLLLLAVAMMGGIYHVAFATPSPQTQPAELVALLPESGVTNPVTAVLLNFRAYDTLLEIAVLLAAVLGILAVHAPTSRPTALPHLIHSMVHWLVPLLILFGGYLLWIGAKAPGGAFQAGAMWACAFALMHLTNLLPSSALRWSLWQWPLVAGIGAFLLSSGIGVAAGQAVLQWFPQWANWQILAIELFATLSVAAALSIAIVGHLHGLTPGRQHD